MSYLFIHERPKAAKVTATGSMDHKTHGSDHIVAFQSRIGSFFASAIKKIYQCNFAFHLLSKAQFKY